jgi:hypothetical protein
MQTKGTEFADDKWPLDDQEAAPENADARRRLDEA